MAARFEICRLVRRYPQRGHPGRFLTALDGVDLELPERSVTALSGPSGAGKSTLARVMLNLEPRDGGEVLCCGRPLADWPMTEFRRRHGIVFQNPSLAVNPLFTAEAIVCEPLRIAGLGRRAARSRAVAAMAGVDLDPGLAGRYPAELSAGQLQRVVLARALVGEADFLVLDEPFSCLDELAASRLLGLLARLKRQRGLGMLLICHHPRHAAALADRLAVIEKGRICPGS